MTDLKGYILTGVIGVIVYNLFVGDVSLLIRILGALGVIALSSVLLAVSDNWKNILKLRSKKK